MRPKVNIQRDVDEPAPEADKEEFRAMPKTWFAILALAPIITGLLICPVCAADSTSIFVVYGMMYQVDGVTPVADAHTIMVANGRSGVNITTTLGSCGEVGKYSVVFMDYETSNAAQVGDVFTVQAIDNLGEIRALRSHVVAVEQVMASKARVDILAGTGVPNSSASQIGTEDCFPCVGETVGIVAHINDCYGTPVPDVVVHFRSDRGLNDVITESPDVTDANGYADAKMTSVLPGTGHIWADIEWHGSSLTIGPSEGIHWSGASATQTTTWGKIKTLY
jgi:hypothetical protein